MDANKFHLESGGDAPQYRDRDKWLQDLQRRFSADLEQKSEVFYNSNPHVDGCSSESEEDASIHHGVVNNSSFYTPCSGAVPKNGRRASTGDRLDDLYRVVKLHSQQLNLLQNQIKSLVKVLQCSCKADIKNELLNNVDQCLRNPQVKPSDDVDELNRLSDVRSDSDVVPKCVFNSDLIASTDESERNFFSTVMGTLRGMLVDSDVETSVQPVDVVEDSDPDTDSTDKTMLNATLEQLKRLGVSFIEKVPDKKKVTFCETARTESSVEIDSLARKYLAQKQRMQKVDALDQIQTMQKKTTDLSLATMKYLQRYKLSKDGKNTDDPRKHRSRSRRSRHDDEIVNAPPERRHKSPIAGKILDSVAIRNDHLIERFLTICEGSLEKTKSTMDLFFCLKSEAPEFFTDRDPLSPAMQDVFQSIDLLPLPQMTPEGYKVLMYRLADSDPDKFHFNDYIKCFFLVGDTRVKTEQTIPKGDVVIFDMKGYQLKHLTRVNLLSLRKYMQYTQEAHPVKLKQIHVVNVSGILDRTLMVAKPFIKSDVFGMVHFHQPDSTTLYQYIPQEILPEEYGGKAGTVSDIKETWKARVEKERVWLKTNPWLAKNSRRNSDRRNLLNFMEGSFRTLSID
ncbi:hypothetical protein GE061_016397 [Apolygus lucorum]|uniref:CRAL-TRIO domain-containing protein n=1 Tax=Apolygus lucorum TaxID=248454 RepID=A0A8S9XI50_APOLU|nr:hypothetical protein GE061_016397 [Apolygus lucorum]